MSDSQKSYSYTNNHSFHPQIAADYDVPIALLVHHLHFWIDRNAKRGANCYDGRTWMYDTIEEIAKHFPYWSLKQVERLLDKAVKKGVLRKGNHNKNKYDRTCWYAFENEEKFAISRNREMKILKAGNEDPEIGTPIPHALPHALPDTSSKEEVGETPKPPPRPQKKSSPIKKERAPHVRTTDKEHQELAQAPHNEILREEAYKVLSEWKEDTPRSKWKKSDCRSIKRWVYDSLKEKKYKRSQGKSRANQNISEEQKNAYDRLF